MKWARIRPQTDTRSRNTLKQIKKKSLVKRHLLRYHQPSWDFCKASLVAEQFVTASKGRIAERLGGLRDMVSAPLTCRHPAWLQGGTEKSCTTPFVSPPCLENGDVQFPSHTSMRWRELCKWLIGSCTVEIRTRKAARAQFIPVQCISDSSLPCSILTPRLCIRWSVAPWDLLNVGIALEWIQVRDCDVLNFSWILACVGTAPQRESCEGQLSLFWAESNSPQSFCV